MSVSEGGGAFVWAKRAAEKAFAISSDATHSQAAGCRSPGALAPTSFDPTAELESLLHIEDELMKEVLEMESGQEQRRGSPRGGKQEYSKSCQTLEAGKKPVLGSAPATVDTARKRQRTEAGAKAVAGGNDVA